MFQPRRAASAAFLLALATLPLIGVLAPRAAAQSAEGVPLPTVAGSVWQIASGYSTATHGGNDPHAIDIVRLDAETAWSEVRSPVRGWVSYVAPDCFAVIDDANMLHLMCHAFHIDGLARGQRVEEGDLLGHVGPPGTVNNNGLAHIHYAVHHTHGGGYLDESVPFTGQYALEGRNLSYSGAPNEHSGQIFTSTNAAAPAAVDPAPSAESSSSTQLSADIVARAESEPNYLVPGWNLVGWTGDDALLPATGEIRDHIQALFTYDALASVFHTYAPDLPAQLNDVDALPFGAGVWVLVTDAMGVVWERPAVELSRSVSLVKGFNLATWTAAERSVPEAVAALGDAVQAVYVWDPIERRFLVHRLGAPAFLNDLEVLLPGQALWILTDRAIVWQQA